MTNTGMRNTGTAAETRLLALWGEIYDLSIAEEVLQWDQETMMPPGGLEGRSKIFSTLAGLRHQRLCSPELRGVVAECAEAAVPGSVLEAQAREALRQVERAVKIPLHLAQEMAEVQSKGQAAWAEARRRSDFALYRPYLERMLLLKREQGQALMEGQSSNGTSVYDVLMDEFEPGITEAELAPLFSTLQKELVPLLQQAAECSRRVDESPAQGSFPAHQQEAFGREMAAAIGFDFGAGRLDLSTHPFCTGFGPGDVRLTWRFEDGDFRPAVFGILHEAGHGLYEQGLPERWHRTPLGGAASLGIHESQSRLWENLVARSRGFWEWALPHLHRHLPSTRGVRVETLWPALHTVRPSLIRVEADEATYNLHVAIRFELERAMFSNRLEVEELPEAWDQAYEDLLGVRPKNAADGVLQDIHWSLGSFGYFPTYTLGTLAASQLFAAAREELGDLEDSFRRGEFRSLLDWLRTNIHAHGSRYSTNELMEKATGRPLTAEPFLESISATVREVYLGG